MAPTPSAARSAGGRLLLVHPSDELYGVDRMLLQMVDAVGRGPDDPALEVWLPTDLEHPPPELALCTRLEERGVAVRHLDLPVLRRAYANPAGLLRLLRRGARLVGVLRRARPTVVCCTSSATLLVAPLARLARVDRVVGQLQEVWTPRDRAALAGPARSCHRLVAVSRAVTRTMPADLRARTVVVPNGTPDPGRWESLGGRAGWLRLVVASRWNSGKGHRTLLEAWARADLDATLVVLGGPPRSGERVDVAALVARLPRPGSVEVVGDVADPQGWIDAADVVLVPSDRPEGFGLVAIEAFARGRPVVASTAGGLADVVTPGVDGWVFPPGDVDALAEVLRRLERTAVAAAGDRARATYETRFTQERFAQRWRDAVLGGTPP